MALIPKPGQAGKWRIIADAKAGGQNERSGKPETFGMGRLDAATQIVQQGDCGAKADVEKAFHQVPMHPQTSRHFAVRVGNQVLIYCSLNFGWSHSPRFFNRLGEAIVVM